jgi:hypothetical protein
MPSYTIALAHDTSFHGFVGVEGDTWEEAVASLTSDDWSECFEEGRGGWEQQQRVVHVEDEDGNIVAEDIAFNCPMIHCQSVIQRLREIQIAADPDAALALFMDQLRTMRPRSDLQQGEQLMNIAIWHCYHGTARSTPTSCWLRPNELLEAKVREAIASHWPGTPWTVARCPRTLAT